jgi:DNA-binding CsgD family transcriptional regulator
VLETVATCHRHTVRESQILNLLTHGLASKQVARQLGISVYTVNEHLGSLYRKCDVTGREELIGRLT